MSKQEGSFVYSNDANVGVGSIFLISSHGLSGTIPDNNDKFRMNFNKTQSSSFNLETEDKILVTFTNGGNTYTFKVIVNSVVESNPNFYYLEVTLFEGNLDNIIGNVTATSIQVITRTIYKTHIDHTTNLSSRINVYSFALKPETSTKWIL